MLGDAWPSLLIWECSLSSASYAAGCLRLFMMYQSRRALQDQTLSVLRDCTGKVPSWSGCAILVSKVHSLLLNRRISVSVHDVLFTLRRCSGCHRARVDRERRSSSAPGEKEESPDHSPDSFEGTKSTDPRDKIYALLRMCPGDAEGIPVDYSIPAAQVCFMQFDILL